MSNPLLAMAKAQAKTGLKVDYKATRHTAGCNPKVG